MKTILLIAISLITLPGIAQNLQWAHTFGGSSTDRPQQIKTDAEGNVYVAGTFFGSATFSDSEIELDGANGIDIYLSKRNSAGNLLWARVISGYGDDNVYDMKIDGENNVFLVGDFLTSIAFESDGNPITLTSAGQRDGYIVKYSSTGAVLAAHALGGATGPDNISNVAIDNDNNIILMGNCEADTDFDFSAENSYTIEGNRWFYILKLNAEFEFISAVKLRGDNIQASTLIVTGNNDYIFSGAFDNHVLFGDEYPGPGVTNSTTVDAAFIIKISENIEYLWSCKIISYAFVSMVDLKIAPNGHILAAGEFKGEGSLFHTNGYYTLQSNGSAKDIYFAKLSQAGALEWARSIGGLDIEEVGGIEADHYGNLLLAGTYHNTLDFDPGSGTAELTPLGNSSSFVARYSASGDFMDVNTFENSSNNSASGIALNDDDAVYLSGWFTGSINFSMMEPGYSFTSAGISDTYLLKMDAYTVGLNHQYADREALIYPNPATNEIRIKTKGIQKLEIYDVYGRLVIRQTSNPFADTHRIDVSQLSPGTYFLRLTADDGFAGSSKFMIEK